MSDDIVYFKASEEAKTSRTFFWLLVWDILDLRRFPWLRRVILVVTLGDAGRLHFFLCLQLLFSTFLLIAITVVPQFLHCDEN